MTDSPPDVLRADPAARRQAMLLLLAVVLLGTPLLWLLDRNRDAIAGWIVSASNDGGVLPMLALFAVLALPAWILGGYLARLGARSLRAGQFPPPGMRVVRDTPVRTGGAGRSTAVALCVLGGLVAFTGTALPVAIVWLLREFSRA